MVGAACTALRTDGRPCRATPMIDEAFCFWHSPNTVEEAAEARRLGGAHRRKKKAVASIYDFRGLRTIANNRLLETRPSRPSPSRTRSRATGPWQAWSRRGEASRP